MGSVLGGVVSVAVVAFIEAEEEFFAGVVDGICESEPEAYQSPSLFLSRPSNRELT